MAAAMRGIPAILHEHANLTDTPWFQKIADRVLERYTDIAIAVSKSTADFVVKARLVQPEKVKVVYLGAPHEEFSRPRSAGEICCRPARARHRDRRFRHRNRHAAARVERQFVSRRCGARGARSEAEREVFSGRRRAAARVARGSGSRTRSRRSLRVRRIRARRGRGAERLRPQRLSVAVGRHAADRIRGARRRRSRSSPPTPTACSISSPTDAMRASCPSATRARWLTRLSISSIDPDERARLAVAARVTAAALRHHRIRAENGAALRDPAATARARRRALQRRQPASRRPVLSRMRVAVVTSTPLFVEGGHLVIARALVQALRDEGHDARWC